MLSSLLRRLRERIFVFTLLWAGFIFAISFLAAPLKFLAPSLTLPVAMEIAYLLFHSFNGIEIGFALLILAITLLALLYLANLQIKEHEAMVIDVASNAPNVTQS